MFLAIGGTPLIYANKVFDLPPHFACPHQYPYKVIEFEVSPPKHTVYGPPKKDGFLEK